jgi:adenosylcobinamide-GDP ribazoletransferase
VTGLLGAIQFLTRVPVRTRTAVPHEQVVPWFGVVGALIGATVGGIAAGLAGWLPVTVAAACAVVVGLMVTGAFHEDGLADIADAFGGGWTVDQRLEILKDSRHGTYGVAALCGSIVVRVAAAASISSRSAVFGSFVAAHVLGRLAAVAAMKSARPARESGLGVSAASALRPLATLLGAATGLAVVAIAVGWWLAPLTGVAVIAATLVIALAVRKIDGIVGDVLGAVEQVVECLVLVVCAGLAAHHRIWWQ